MKPAPEYQLIRPGLAFWQAYDSVVKTDLSCCSVETPEGLVLCDPIPLAQGALEELLAGRVPRGILLTSGNHERDALPFSRRFGSDIWAHTAARGHVLATRWFEGGEILFGGVEAIALEGFAPGETAFHMDGILLIGDALINIAPYGFSILPDKYCADPKLARQSLKELLRLPLEVMTFAHGLPIVSKASERLAALVSGLD